MRIIEKVRFLSVVMALTAAATLFAAPRQFEVFFPWNNDTVFMTSPGD